jgi:hypothetical protein
LWEGRARRRNGAQPRALCVVATAATTGEVNDSKLNDIESPLQAALDSSLRSKLSLRLTLSNQSAINFLHLVCILKGSASPVLLTSYCTRATDLWLQHSLPQLPPQHYLTPQLSISHSLAPQHSTPLLPQHSMPLLPQHSTPLLQTVESRLAGPETSLDIASLQLPEASAAAGTACQPGLGPKHCSSASLSSSAAVGANIGTCRICFEQVRLLSSRSIL